MASTVLITGASLRLELVPKGTTFLATEAYRLVPGLMQWMMSQNVK